MCWFNAAGKPDPTDECFVLTCAIAYTETEHTTPSGNATETLDASTTLQNIIFMDSGNVPNRDVI